LRSFGVGLDWIGRAPDTKRIAIAEVEIVAEQSLGSEDRSLAFPRALKISMVLSLGI